MQEMLFPVLELEMQRDGLKIRLADEQASLSVTLPKAIMEGIVAQWQRFQSGNTAQDSAYARYYTGGWSDLAKGGQP